ncbi:hypothetical protein GCM10027430_25120 [Lysobacter tyrosinilyticus]
MAQAVIGEIVEFADLQRLSGYQRLADVQRWADLAGVPAKPCRGGLWTTLAALNYALGVRNAGPPDDSYPLWIV